MGRDDSDVLQLQWTITMKSPDDTSFQQWNENPEPSVGTFDPQTILDTGGSHDAYLWHSMQASEQWLAYDGPMVEVGSEQKA